MVRKLAVLAGAGVLLLAACSAPTKEASVTGVVSTKRPFVSLLERDAVPYKIDAAAAAIEVIEVRLSMFEFGYGPERLEVPTGATIRFIFDNEGTIEHEAIIGDIDVQLAQRPAEDTGASHDDNDDTSDAPHDDDDTDGPHDDDTESGENTAHDDDTTAPDDDSESDLHGDHGDTPTLILDAGASGDLLVAFEEPGDFLIGCHIPGHWESGMRASISVVNRASGEAS